MSVYDKTYTIKMRALALAAASLCALFTLSSCETGGEVKGKVTDGINGSGTPTPNPNLNFPSSSWSFLLSSDYTFDPTKINFSAGNVTLKTVNTTFNDSSSFATGAHVGTVFSGSKLTLSTTTPALGADSILAAKAANLKGYWKFNGGWTDSSGNGRTFATLTGSPGFTGAGMFGSQAALYNSTMNAATASTTVDFTAGYTVAAWVYPTDGVTAFQEVTRKNGLDYQLAFISGNAFRCRSTHTITALYDGAVGSYLNKWTHVACVLDPTAHTLSLYVNGVLKGSTNFTGTMPSTASTILSGNLSFAGRVDELAMWNTTLTAAELQTLYSTQATKYGNDTNLTADWAPRWGNLVGYWKMDGNWVDSSPTGKDLTSSGAGAVTSATSPKVGTGVGTFDGTAWAASTTGGNYAFADKSFSVALWFKSSSSIVEYLAANGGNASGGWTMSLISGSVGFALRNTSNTNIGWNSTAFTFADGAWHHVVAVVTTNTVTETSNLINVYIDGKIQGGSTTYPNQGPYKDPSTTFPIVIGARLTGSNPFLGSIDDAAIWSAPLTAGEAALLYNRQKSKYAGTYESPIIDLGSAGPWQKLTPKTAIPFLKELTGASGNESTADYADVVNSAGTPGAGSSLASNMLALWHFNETAGTTIADSSGGTNTLTLTTPPALGATGKFGNGALFTRASLHYGTTPTINVGNTFTISVWAKLGTIASGWHTLISNTGTGGSSDGIKFAVNSWGTSDGKVLIETGNGTASATASTPVGATTMDEWHHYLVTVNRGTGTARVYVDGIFKNSGTTTVRTDFANNTAWNVGRVTTGTVAAYLGGSMDEMAIWSRVLSDNEILELYRRGANRISYQVRSCVDAACNCDSLTATGTSTDCSGDGTTNDLAFTDPRQSNNANWHGPDGTSATFYSELQNNSAISASGAPTGTVNTGSFLMDWTTAFYAAGAKPASNRYFQYRAYLESDDATGACTGSTPCLPELASAEVAPTGRYYGGGPTIVNNTALTYTKIMELTKSETSACTKYQFSTDGGSTWKFWNGAAWATTTNGLTDSNYFSDFSGHLTDLPAGNFKFRAYLTTNTGGDFFSSCALQSVTAYFQP